MTNQNKATEAVLSINEAVEIINNRNYCILSNIWSDKGRQVCFCFNTATLYNNRLIMEKYNNHGESVSLPLEDNAGITHIADNSLPTIRFTLANGEEWLVSLCGDKTDYCHYSKSFEEIEEEEFLYRLNKSQKVAVSHVIENLHCNAIYDAVDIKYDEDGGSEIQVTLIDSSNQLNNKCASLTLFLDAETKYHIENEDNDFSRIVISLGEMPLLSELCLILFYDKD